MLLTIKEYKEKVMIVAYVIIMTLINLGFAVFWNINDAPNAMIKMFFVFMTFFSILTIVYMILK